MKKLQMTHLLPPSPWPILGTMSIFMIMISMITMIYDSKMSMMPLSMMMSMGVLYMWSKDIYSESSLEGQHSKKVTTTLKTGMILFIVSEVFLFVSMFWAFFHSSMSPSVELGMSWPPSSIKTFNYQEIPMMNSIILLSSGSMLTLSHHYLMNKEMEKSMTFLMITINLGLMFTMIQMMEYTQSTVKINDSVYGSSFFMATGLHGLHVIVGSTFLTIVMIQMMTMTAMSHQFISFDMATWYWHFVDVVWLFLLVSIYWWGS